MTFIYGRRAPRAGLDRNGRSRGRGSRALRPPPRAMRKFPIGARKRVTHNFGDKGVRESGMLIRSEYCVLGRSLDMRSRLRPEMSERCSPIQLWKTTVEDHSSPVAARHGAV